MLEPLYTAFARYRLPDGLQVCEQCGPEWTAQDIRSTPLRSLSLPQLEAIHLISLDHNDFRHFFPRLIELLLADPAPVFAFAWPDCEAGCRRGRNPNARPYTTSSTVSGKTCWPVTRPSWATSPTVRP